MEKIHPTAIVSSKAKLGNNVNIGPYCIINENVEIPSENTLLLTLEQSGVAWLHL